MNYEREEAVEESNGGCGTKIHDICTHTHTHIYIQTYTHTHTYYECIHLYICQESLLTIKPDI